MSVKAAASAFNAESNSPQLEFDWRYAARGCGAATRGLNVNIRLIAYLALAVASTGVGAADFTDTALVVSSTPVVERVIEPRQECTTANTPAAQPTERGVAAPILGGVTGAVIGRQVGGGSGRDVATGAGAVIGTVAGDRVANPDSNRSYTGAVVGGVAGAILGNQVGKGRGNAAATAAGAIAGAMIGDRIDNAQTAQAQPVQRCRTVETTREGIKGYTVVYRYNGRDVTTTLPYDPGRTVRVAVGVIEEQRPVATGGGMLGTNVRDVTQPTPAATTPISTQPAGDYRYRY
jgi:uncharacterized protein YcfJ